MPQHTRYLTRLYRFSRVFLHTLVGLAILASFWHVARAVTKQSLIRWWCRGLLRCFNITLTIHGAAPQPNAVSHMFVANHISWVDVFALNSVSPLRFIAKADIQHWPVFGYLVRKSGTLFIDRVRRKDTARMVDLAAKSLRQGDNIGFFPEGTTTDGTHLLSFKSGVMQAVIDANAVIQPVVVYYPDSNRQANLMMAYAGDTSLVSSIGQILRLKNPLVELHFLPQIQAQGLTRQALAQQAFQAVRNQLSAISNG